MLNNLEEVRKRIEIINKLIPSFETEERKEIKKNNKLIEELKKELTIYKDFIYNELINKKEKSLPKDETGNAVTLTSVEDDANNYVAFDLYFYSATEQTIVFNEGTQVIAKNVDTPGSEASDKGLKSSVRVGFLVQGNDPTSTPATAKALATGTTATQTIWEPNADIHTEYATNMSGATGVMAYMGGKAAATDPVAMTNTTNFETITAGTHNLKTSTEATKFPAGTIFSFQPGITKVRVYIWLEGQDVDNEDTASLGTGVGVKLNFKLADQAG